MKLPEYPAHSIERKRAFILQELPAPLTRMDEHWQIFDDYTAWPEYRLRQIRIPQTKQWFRMREEIFAPENGTPIGVAEVTREFLPSDEIFGDVHHPEKEIRKNRYFYEFEGREVEIDIFLGPLWGLMLAQVVFDKDEDPSAFLVPEFAILDVSENEFFRGENLIYKNFEDVRIVISGER